MAQNTPAQTQYQRVPIMDAGMLEDRTRPLVLEPMPIWLRHRLQRRHMAETTTAPSRAGQWLRQLRGRTSRSPRPG